MPSTIAKLLGVVAPVGSQRVSSRIPFMFAPKAAVQDEHKLEKPADAPSLTIIETLPLFVTFARIGLHARIDHIGDVVVAGANRVQHRGGNVIAKADGVEERPRAAGRPFRVVD